METDELKSGKNDESSIPELKKSNCPICQKEFSSIWVLKAHTEEVHKVVVPQELVQKYIEELKSNSEQETSVHHKNSCSDNDNADTWIVYHSNIRNLDARQDSLEMLIKNHKLLTLKYKAQPQEVLFFLFIFSF